MKQNQWIPLLYVYFWARLQQSMQQPGQTNCCFPSKELRLSCSIFTKKLACGIIPGMFAFSALKAAESFVTGSLFGPDLESWVVLSKLSTTRRQVLSLASDQLDHMSNMHDYCSFPKHLIFEEPYLAGLWTSCSGIRVELIGGGGFWEASHKCLCCFVCRILVSQLNWWVQSLLATVSKERGFLLCLLQTSYRTIVVICSSFHGCQRLLVESRRIPFLPMWTLNKQQKKIWADWSSSSGVILNCIMMRYNLIHC